MLSKNERIKFLKNELKKLGLEGCQSEVYHIIKELYNNYRKYNFFAFRIKKISDREFLYYIVRSIELKDLKWELENKPFRGIELQFEKLTLKSLKYINEVKEVL